MFIILVIEHLADHSEYVDIVINWTWKEFGNINNYAFFESIIKNSLRNSQLPLTFIALWDNELVGTIGLWRSDLLSRQDLYPWLSALFVKENYRGRRIGQELQHFLVKYCRDAGFTELFLNTDICNYYEKTDWKYLEDGVKYSGEYTKIYKHDL